MAVLAAATSTIHAEEPSASPTATAEPSVSESEEDETTKVIDSPSPDGKYAFLYGNGEDEKTIDLIDKKTEKILQHIEIRK
jgi:hypothetical protein